MICFFFMMIAHEGDDWRTKVSSLKALSGSHIKSAKAIKFSSNELINVFVFVYILRFVVIVLRVYISQWELIMCIQLGAKKWPSKKWLTLFNDILSMPFLFKRVKL